LNGVPRSYPRVAFLPDTFFEVNGIAHTARHLEAFARRRQIPLLSVRCGPKNEKTSDGAVCIVQLQRGTACVSLDANLDYDVFLSRYAGRIATEIRNFGAEVIHLTGPGDMGAVGLYLSWLLNLPLVISWHTNLHEYAATRSEGMMRFAGKSIGKIAGLVAGRGSLEILRQFYRAADITLAPNQELVDFTQELIKKPCYLMRRGVDTHLFSPRHRKRVNKTLQIGYVGRLTPEKNVRFLADLGSALQSRCRNDFEFVIVGEGSQERWLRANVPNARLTGVLRGEALARAYADMDLFVFPSKTDTFGNVILEALASGVPAVVTNQGGPKFLVKPGITGFVADIESEFVDAVDSLMTDPQLLARMRQSAVEYALEQSWDHVFESVWQVYEESIRLHSEANRAKAGVRRRPSGALLSSRVHGGSSS
jgi:glycosyltransferase involved in cell wall biosynthesis